MKKILALTDFTENAAHAVKSAVTLAGTLNTDLLLYNTKLILPVTTYYADYAGGPWVIDDFERWENENKEKLQKLIDELQPIIANLEPQLHKPVVTYECGEGNIGENIAEIVRYKDIELIVMGASSQGAFEHILNGSDTGSIINHATCPVLVIPPNSDLKKLKKVIFATDFDEADMKAIHYLIKLGGIFNYHIEIVHISLSGKNGEGINEYESLFLKEMKRLKYPSITYKVVSANDVIQGLNTVYDEDEADVLAMVHYQDSYIVRLLRHSTTKKALANQKNPVLIFPSKMENTYE